MTNSKRLIKQSQLDDILSRRDLIVALKRDLAREEEALAQQEAMIVYDIQHGAPTQPGSLACGINVQPGQRRPKWKEEAAAVLGAAWVEAVIEKTEPGLDVTKLVILRQNGPKQGTK